AQSYQFERQLNQLFGRFRENPAWGPKLLLGRKTWIHTVAHAGLSAPKVPDRQEIRSTPCVDASVRNHGANHDGPLSA
ncbi:hypothetical protein, partial [Stenotrophomonas maltophilia]|uniref:hypothetical protein n=1 Tax=Stenotrophomonas maltophilia TaxID=40324 RepID=UPI001C65F6D6